MNWRKIKLSDKLREELKNPMGELITGSEESANKRIVKIVKKLNPESIICVGDAVSRFFSKNKISTKLFNIAKSIQRVD